MATSFCNSLFVYSIKYCFCIKKYVSDWTVTVRGVQSTLQRVFCYSSFQAVDLDASFCSVHSDFCSVGLTFSLAISVQQTPVTGCIL